MHAHKSYLSSPGEHDGNEPEILASILNELILELQKKKQLIEMIKKFNIRWIMENLRIWRSCEPVCECTRC